jgi:hypothetical protein
MKGLAVYFKDSEAPVIANQEVPLPVRSDSFAQPETGKAVWPEQNSCSVQSLSDLHLRL